MYLYGKNDNYKLLKLMDNDVSQISPLLCFAEKYSLWGNIWQHYIAYLIMTDENPFSLFLERHDGTGSCEEFAKSDLLELYKLFVLPFKGDFCAICDYMPINATTCNEDARKGKMIREFSGELASSKDFDTFYDRVRRFYITYGVGFFGLNKAFYLKDDGTIVPVTHIKEVSFDKLRGYETQKAKIIANTEAFVSGGFGNNILLYGDSGTGKSTSIKAVLNMFFSKGLRMIQVQKHQFVHLGELTEQLKDRNYKFVLYMDDLSFEDFEVEYKYLKAAIEGGLQEKSENVLIYATSNRRHIIKETFSEREGGNDIHRNESIQEKISLSERFGLMIYYPKPTQNEFFDMALFLAERNGINLSDDDIIAEAKKWSMSHSGSLSGRAAEQFITNLKTTLKK